MDVLRERYARGEIDEDEFERRLAKLEARKR
jgi:putative membrane protein